MTDPAGSTRHHKVSVTGLQPSTGYPYTVTSAGTTASGTFRTAATPGQTFSFAMIGDFGGGGPGPTENAASIKAAGTDFIQTVGDNVYPSSGLPDPNFATTYSDFDQRLFKPFGATIKEQAFHPANGNKEYYGDGQWWDAFPMHGSNHSWYSYNWGDAHILVLDTEVPYSPGTEQYAFAEADLQGVRTRSGGSWLHMLRRTARAAPAQARRAYRPSCSTVPGAECPSRRLGQQSQL